MSLSNHQARLVDGLDDFLQDGYARTVAALTPACGSRLLAEEAVQEALAQALARKVPVADWRGWVYTAARNYGRSAHRRRRAEVRAVRRIRAHRSVVADPTESSAAEEGVAVLIAVLTQREREVVTLHYLLDFDVAATAEALGVSQGTVKTLLSRSRHKLRSHERTTGRDEGSTS